MKFVLLVFHGPNPGTPGSDRWNALPEAEKQKVYADYAELNKTEGVMSGLPLGLPEAARTVQVRDGKVQVKNGTYLAGRKVRGSVLLGDRDAVKIGPVTLSLRVVRRTGSTRSSRSQGRR